MLKNGGLAKRKAQLAMGGAGPWSKQQAQAIAQKTGARGSKGRGSSKTKLESPVSYPCMDYSSALPFPSRPSKPDSLTHPLILVLI